MVTCYVQWLFYIVEACKNPFLSFLKTVSVSDKMSCDKKIQCDEICVLKWLWVEVTKSISSVSLFCQFIERQNTGSLFNTTIMFDRCHLRLAAVTPVNYKRCLKNVACVFVMSEIFLTQTNGALVTTIPDTSEICNTSQQHHRQYYENYQSYELLIIRNLIGFMLFPIRFGFPFSWPFCWGYFIK